MSSSSTPSPVAALFKNLGDQLLTDVEGNVSALLSAFFNNVKATPTPQNVVAQGAILAGSALLQLPNLEAAGISQLADTGLAALALVKVPAVVPAVN